MSVDYPHGAVELIELTSGANTVDITSNYTRIDAGIITGDTTLNLTLSRHLPRASMILVECSTSGAETFTFGSGIDAPIITGFADKKWCQVFWFDGTVFLPCAEKSFTEAACPTITLGDFQSSSQPFVGGDADGSGATIDGGSGVPIIVVESGHLPAGITGLIVTEYSPGLYAWIFDGTYTEVGKSIFTVGGTVGGCPIATKEYTIEVWYEQTNNTPTDIIAGAGNIQLDLLSTMPIPGGVLGVNCAVVSTQMKITLSAGDLTGTTLTPYLGSNSANSFYVSGSITGQQIDGATFSINGVNAITVGTPPYSGVYSTSYDNWNGYDPNDIFEFDFDDRNGTAVGTIDYVTMIFKPL